jgi:ADP-ribose pyrophosphatase
MTEEIVGRRVEYERPWLAVEAKDVRRDGAAEVETWYSVRTHDYAAVLAITEDGRIPLVRQYRPAIEVRSLELPSGLIEAGEDPADAVRRELLEETGCQASTLEPLGRFDLDSGRMQTAQWGFVARDVQVVAAGPTGDEPDLELLFVRPDELRQLALDGEFRMAGHLALLAAALLRGVLG